MKDPSQKPTYGRIYSPKPLESLQGIFVTDIVAGSGHTLGLTLEKRVFAWGDNSNG